MWNLGVKEVKTKSFWKFRDVVLEKNDEINWTERRTNHIKIYEFREILGAIRGRRWLDTFGDTELNYCTSDNRRKSWWPERTGTSPCQVDSFEHRPHRTEMADWWRAAVDRVRGMSRNWPLGCRTPTTKKTTRLVAKGNRVGCAAKYDGTGDGDWRFPGSGKYFARRRLARLSFTRIDRATNRFRRSAAPMSPFVDYRVVPDIQLRHFYGQLLDSTVRSDYIVSL